MSAETGCLLDCLDDEGDVERIKEFVEETCRGRELRKR